MLPALPGEQPHLVRWDPALMRRRHLVGIKLHQRVSRLVQQLPFMHEEKPPTGAWLTVLELSFADNRGQDVINKLQSSALRIGLRRGHVGELPKHYNFADQALHFAEATFCLLSDKVRVCGHVLL